MTLTLFSLHISQKLLKTIDKSWFFSSLRTEAQGKPLTAVLSSRCRIFKDFSCLIFYLPQSISWHICSENLVSSYFFQDHYLLAVLSQTSSSWFTSSFWLIFINSLSSEEFGRRPSKLSQPGSSPIEFFSPSPTDSTLRVFLKHLFFFLRISLGRQEFSHLFNHWFIHVFIH